jgi:hypothetical protein
MKQDTLETEDTPKRRISQKDLSSILPDRAIKAGNGYFKRVQVLPDYRLEVIMETDTVIRFDFRSRLKTARFGRLSDKNLFSSVRTDGGSLIFEIPGTIPVQISAQEFMDLVLIDRTKLTHITENKPSNNSRS